MQRIHPENDLLQASRRHHPYQHTVGLGQRDIPGLHSLSPRADLCRDLCETARPRAGYRESRPRAAGRRHASQSQKPRATRVVIGEDVGAQVRDEFGA